METEKSCKIGFAITGSFCTHEKIKEIIQDMVDDGMDIIPIFSENVQTIDSRFGKAEVFTEQIEKMTGHMGIRSIQAAEPIGPNGNLDAMVIAPCTGNTMAKLALDIIDTPVTMAAKSHLRNDRPLVIAPSTNNGLSGNAENIGKLLNRKNYYFVPFRQDNPITKPRSIVFEEEYLIKTIEYALEGTQISPILL